VRVSVPDYRLSSRSVYQQTYMYNFGSILMKFRISVQLNKEESAGKWDIRIRVCRYGIDLEFFPERLFCTNVLPWWLGSRVVSVLDSGAEGPGSNLSRDAVG